RRLLSRSCVGRSDVGGGAVSVYGVGSVDESGQGIGGQPLTAPASRPDVSRRCSRPKTIRLGNVDRNAPAASGPSRTTPWMPTNRARVTGTVAFSGSCRITRAKKNSFHADTKANKVAATTPGASN